MNEVILNSLKNLKSEDVHAMRVLKSLPARDYTGAGVPADQIKTGEPIYKARCEKCIRLRAAAAYSLPAGRRQRSGAGR